MNPAPKVFVSASRRRLLPRSGLLRRIHGGQGNGLPVRPLRKLGAGSEPGWFRGYGWRSPFRRSARPGRRRFRKNGFPVSQRDRRPYCVGRADFCMDRHRRSGACADFYPFVGYAGRGDQPDGSRTADQCGVRRAAARHYAARLHVAVPGWALRLLYGEASGMLVSGPCAIPRKLLDAGFVFNAPEIAAFMSKLGKTAEK